MSDPHPPLNADLLRAFAQRPEVRAASYPLGGRAIRASAVRGGFLILPESVFSGRTRALIGALIVVLVPFACVMASSVDLRRSEARDLS